MQAFDICNTVTDVSYPAGNREKLCTLTREHAARSAAKKSTYPMQEPRRDFFCNSALRDEQFPFKILNIFTKIVSPEVGFLFKAVLRNGLFNHFTR